MKAGNIFVMMSRVSGTEVDMTIYSISDTLFLFFLHNIGRGLSNKQPPNSEAHGNISEDIDANIGPVLQVGSTFIKQY